MSKAHKDSLFILGYMNDIPERFFVDNTKRYFVDAWRAVARMKLSIYESHRNYRALGTLRENAKPIYQLANKSLARITTDSPLIRLNPGVKRSLIPAWKEMDLQHSQLAICAKLWEVTPLIDFLNAGHSIWQHLDRTVGLEPDKAAKVKHLMKRAVYAICFGKTKERVAFILSRQFARLGLERAGDKFINDPFIAALNESSRAHRENIQTYGGAYGPDDQWYKLEGKKPEALTAQIAQAWELQLILPVFKYAIDETDFQIALYQYDGVSIDFTQNAAKHMDAINRLIVDNVRRLQIPTSPRWK